MDERLLSDKPNLPRGRLIGEQTRFRLAFRIFDTELHELFQNVDPSRYRSEQPRGTVVEVQTLTMHRAFNRKRLVRAALLD